MSPIQFALAEIRDTIDESVLELAFMPKTKYRLSRQKYLTTTIEQQILDKVINGRVRRYIDSRGATEIVIPLNGIPRTEMGYQGWAMHIPKTHTRGRSITQAISIHVGLAGYTGTMGNTGITQFGIGVTTTQPINEDCSRGDLNVQAARAILDNQAPVELNYTANVYLIDENTIYCEDRMVNANLELRCKVSSDNEFSFIQGGHVHTFAMLCRLATQAYIYRTLNVASDKAILEGGVEIGKLREIVDGYSDADEQFLELVATKWKKIQRMADKPRRNNYLNSLMGKGF